MKISLIQRATGTGSFDDPISGAGRCDGGRVIWSATVAGGGGALSGRDE
jgi:hypothetical protein